MACRIVLETTREGTRILVPDDRDLKQGAHRQLSSIAASHGFVWNLARECFVAGPKAASDAGRMVAGALKSAGFDIGTGAAAR